MEPNQPGNTMLQLARDFVYYTQESVFLTGKAGTGKTTFLRQLRQDLPKQHAVLAPTGVAAIHAGGSTIHAFFQLPFGPFLPLSVSTDAAEGITGSHALLARLRYNREKRELLRSIDLLIIDEISMVRCDVLDAIDTILRHVRASELPFGGVQMLFIGDMFQLPPVVQEAEWAILRECYHAPFFFNSLVIQRKPPLLIELLTVYRQQDSRFINLLNEVRNKQVTPEGLQLLGSRVIPDFVAPADQHYIILTTHNRQADAINEKKLSDIAAAPWTFRADVEGSFGERNFPAEELLVLKAGAQVMFLKNDAQGKRYFNGKIGVVTSVSQDEVEVTCAGDVHPIQVKRETWRNIQYTLNRQTAQVEEQELGSFTQFPLRLAWAVTIHKSQGLTFEHAVIDASASFSAGQVYVALSRCKSLEGMILLSHIPESAIRVDSRVKQYASGAQPESALQQAFSESRSRFQQELVLESFSGKGLMEGAGQLQKVWQAYPDSFGPDVKGWLETFMLQCSELQDTAGKFSRQLSEYFTSATGNLEGDDWLNTRLVKAAPWFGTRLDDIVRSIRHQPAVSDSLEHAAEFEAALAKTLAAARRWQQLATACSEGFHTFRILKARSKVNISEVIGQAYAGTKRSLHAEPVTHPVLLSRLKEIRDRICEEENKPIYLVAGSNTLKQMAEYLPQNQEQLMQISGFGPRKAESYGQVFLDAVIGYCEEHGLENRMEAIKPKRQRRQGKVEKASESKPEKISTKQQTLLLWQSGRTPQQIAAERQLQLSTIEGHLFSFIASGELTERELISEAEKHAISEVILDLQTNRLGAVREVMGEAVSFGKIRYVMEGLLAEGKLIPGEEVS